MLLAFFRISTNGRAFARPLSVTNAIGVVQQWLGHPNVRIVSENDQHWTILMELMKGVGTGGNLTSDAHLAALAISHGAALVSCDADFARFQQLRWENPLSR